MYTDPCGLAGSALLTSEGRLLGGVLIVVGVGLFGAFTAFVANWFMAPDEQRQDRAIHEIRDELRSIRELLEKQPSGRPPSAPRG